MPRRRRRPVDRIRRIIYTCRMVEERGLNPFNIEVKEELEKLDEYLDGWESYEELCLDAEAVNRLTKVVESQRDWLSEEASTLYMDPVFVTYKLKRLSSKVLAEVFMKVWRPIACLEEISKERLIEAIDYWNRLKPLRSRWSRLRGRYKTRGFLSLEELKKRGIVVDDAFYRNLETILAELKEAYKTEGAVSYWRFIARGSFDETVRRAYMLSFLSTYGYVGFEKVPLEDNYLLTPRDPGEPKGQPESLPVSIDYEKWKTVIGGGDQLERDHA